MRNSRLLLATLSLASCSALANPIKIAGLQAENRIEGEYIVLFKQNTDRQLVSSLTHKINRETKGQSGVRAFTVMNGFAGRLSKFQLAELSRHPAVKSIEVNQVVRLAPYQNPSKQITRTLAPGAWSIDRSDQANLPLDQTYMPAATGDGVHAYVIDSGIHTSHVGFEGRADWVFTASNVGGGNGDNNGHGTHLAGNIGSSSYGIAKEVNLHAVKVLDAAGTGTLAGLIEGINYVTNHHQKPAVATIGFHLPVSTALSDAVTFSTLAGVTYAVPVGDESRQACDYSPGNLLDVISVAATFSDDRASMYSNKGACVDMYAPGLYVNSVWHSSDTANNSISHSPVAAAHVAGAAALVLGQDSSCTPAQVKEQLNAHAANDVLTQVPENTVNRLLNVPTNLSDYSSCQQAPLAMDTDVTNFVNLTRAGLITDMNDGVSRDEYLNEATAAGIQRRGYAFSVDAATDVTKANAGGFIEFNFELGVKAFGFEYAVNTEHSFVRIKLADGTEKTHLLPKSASGTTSFAGFYYDETIVFMEIMTPEDLYFHKFYRSSAPDGVSVYTTDYQSDFTAIQNTTIWGDYTKTLAKHDFLPQHDTQHGSLISKNGVPVGVVETDPNDEPYRLGISTMLTSGNFADADFEVVLNQPANQVSFNTHFPDAGQGTLTVYSGESSVNRYVINHNQTDNGFLAIQSSELITSIRWQSTGGNNWFTGISDFATDTAEQMLVPIPIAGVDVSSEDYMYPKQGLIDGSFNPDIGVWRSQSDDAAASVEFFMSADVPATHYRLSRGNCQSNDYLAGTWTLYVRDNTYQWAVVDQVTQDQSSLYPMATGCNGFGPTYQIDPHQSFYQYKLEFNASPLSNVSGVSIGEVEFLY